MVRGLVVEEERERQGTGGDDTVRERLHDSGGVLLVAHGDADERARVRVHVELEVEDEALFIDDDGHLHAVADPLRPGEVRPERAAHRALGGSTASTSPRVTSAVRVEDVRDESATEGHA